MLISLIEALFIHSTTLLDYPVEFCTKMCNYQWNSSFDQKCVTEGEEIGQRTICISYRQQCGDGQREGWQGLGGGGDGEIRDVCNSLNNKNNINIQYLVHTVVCVDNHLRYYWNCYNFYLKNKCENQLISYEWPFFCNS